jgi:metacaspase-1
LFNFVTNNYYRRSIMKKALIMGLNAYYGCELRGCINDALLLYKVLTEVYGFDTKNIKVATDRECDQKGILNLLKWLVSGVQPGDTVIWTYSGHGSQVQVTDITSSLESDGRDEIICPIDIDCHWDDPIRDDDLGNIFRRLPDGVNISVILDSCHSGTGLRGNCRYVEPCTESDWVNRFYPPPISNLATNPALTLDDNLNFILPMRTKDLDTQKRKVIQSALQQGNAVLISGCGEQETSADAFINGRFHGAMTYYLVETLRDNNWRMSYQDLVLEVNRRLDGKQYDQNPQCEGKPELMSGLFLGGV